MARSTKKKSSVVKIDFTGVQSRQLLPEDDYLVVVEEVNQTTSSNDNDQLEFVFSVKEGKFEGQKLWFYCPLTDNSLWKLHGLLTALGQDVPDDELDLDTDELVGLELMAVVQHETYDGVKRSKMMDFYAVEEGGDKEDDKKSSKKKGSKEKDEEEDDSPAARRKARREARKNRGKDEEEEKPSRSRRGKKDEEEEDDKSSKKKGGKKLAKLSADELQGMDEDDLEDVIEKYELEVELDDYKTLRKKAAAVIDALEDKDMIEGD